MAYLQIKNFKFGVDTRKSELTSQLGSLETCENGHINQGGEIEKKNTFAFIVSIPDDSAKLGIDVSAFGLTLFSDSSVNGPAPNPHNLDPAGRFQWYLALIPKPLLPPPLPQNVTPVDIIATCPFAGGVFILVHASDSKVYGFYMQYTNGTMKMTWVASDGTNVAAADGAWVPANFGASQAFYVTTSVLPGINSAANCFNFKSRVYITTNPVLYFCAIADPLHWTSGSGAGNVTVTNWDFVAQAILAGQTYQSYLALFSNDTGQTWSVPADPTQFSQVQVFKNTGTLAKLSVQPLGDLDVMFLNASGLRSLRVRDSSLNAYVNDMGSPVDDLVQDSIFSTANWAADACGITEPLSGRYWCFIKDVLYVLSYFPSIKIVGWSTYKTTALDVQGNRFTFVPKKFVIYNNMVFAWAAIPDYLNFHNNGNGVFNFGNAYQANPFQQFDSDVLTVETPWLDAGKPATKKTSQGFDSVFYGNWTFYVATNYLDDPAIVPGATGIVWRKVVPTSKKPTPNGLFFPMQGVSTHVKFKAVSMDNVQATLSSIMWHYTDSGEKP